MDLIDKFQNYVKNIKLTDKICVLYHGYCGDGLGSAVITIKSLERILKRKVDFRIHYTVFEITDELIDYFKKNSITKVVVVDNALYAREDMIKKAENVVDILIIDHHEYVNDLNSEKTTFIHASLYNNKIKSHFYPASKLVYDLFSTITDVSDLDWIACMGLISDRGYNQWKAFVDSVLIKYKIPYNDNIFMTELGTCVSNVGGGRSFKEAIDSLFELLYNAKSYKEVLNAEFLIKYKKIITEEMQRLILLRNKAEVYKDLIIYYCKPKFKVGANVSSALSFDYFVGKTIVLICDYGEEYCELNARNQIGTVRTNDLLQMAMKGIPGPIPGGHAPASGGKLHRDYIQKFISNLKQAYDKLLIINKV
jgi:single-stranded DNA-specific DHH superfamily exonuclease